MWLLNCILQLDSTVSKEEKLSALEIGRQYSFAKWCC